MMLGSAFSVPRARAGKQSVTRFIQRRCTGLSIVKPMRVAVKIERTSLMLEPSRN